MNILVSPAAHKDLDDIRNYISVKLCNPTAAERVITNIISAVKTLREQPFIGAQLNSKIEFDTPLRYLVNGNYLVFYSVDVDNDKVEIVRIIYGRRDYAKIIFGGSDFEEDTED